MARNTLSAHHNQGFQLRSNSGNVHVNIHGQPGKSTTLRKGLNVFDAGSVLCSIEERSPTRLSPSATVPFRRDLDFGDRDTILAKIGEKCSEPASRVALVGLGGVGKSQLAIEYSYRIKEQYPQTWIFWVHPSNAARFEEGYRTIANRIKLRRDESTADILL